MLYTLSNDGELKKILPLIRDEPEMEKILLLVKESKNLVSNLREIADTKNHPKRTMPRISVKESEKAKRIFWIAADRNRRRNALLNECIIASEMHFYRTLRVERQI